VQSSLVSFFLSRRQSVHLTVSFVENLLQVTLCLKIKLLDLLGLVHTLWVNLCVTKHHSCPDLFLHLMQINV
jgi:hypothetical protein